MTSRPLRAPSAARDLAKALDAWAGPLRHGLEHAGGLRVDGLEIEVSIRVRRHVPAPELAAWRTEALGWLTANPVQARRCCCSVGDPKAGRFTRRAQRDCSRSVAAVLVTPALHKAGHTFLAVCKAHREGHRIAPHKVLAVVDLSPEELAPILRQAQRQVDAWAPDTGACR